MPLYILNPLYTLSSTNPPQRRPSRRSSAVRPRSYRRPSRVPLRAVRRRLPSSSPVVVDRASSPARASRRRREYHRSHRVPFPSRAPPRAPSRGGVATTSPRDCCVTISAVHLDRGFARARVVTDDANPRSRRRRRERQKNVRLAIVERGAYLGRPRALNHSLVIHHVRHHGPVRRRRANARRAVTSWMDGDGRRGGGWGSM